MSLNYIGLVLTSLFCVAFTTSFHIADNKINESSQNLLNLIHRDTKSIHKNLKTKKLP